MRYQSLKLFVFASYFVLNISAHAQSTEYELKAAYLFNLFSFVLWQEKSFTYQSNYYNLCILGQHNFSQEITNYLEQHNPKYNSDRQIRLFYLKAVEEAVTTYHCHLLFISQSEENNYLNILAIASLRPILTVGESEGFAALGGMIEFYKVDNKIKLRINKKIINWAGLTLRAKLLQVSTILDSSMPLPEKQFNFIDAPITFPETPQPQITFTPYISKTNEKEKALAKTPDFFSFDSEYFYNKSQLNQWVKETVEWVVISLKIMVGIAILIAIILLVKLWWREKTR